MPKLYRLKRPIPWSAAGTEWADVTSYEPGTILDSRVMRRKKVGGGCMLFPLNTFNDWFEEIQSPVTFTKRQVEAIEKVIPRFELDPGGNRVRLRMVADLYDFLDKNTES